MKLPNSVIIPLHFCSLIALLLCFISSITTLTPYLWYCTLSWLHSSSLNLSISLIHLFYSTEIFSQVFNLTLQSTFPPWRTVFLFWLWRLLSFSVPHQGSVGGPLFFLILCSTTRSTHSESQCGLSLLRWWHSMTSLLPPNWRRPNYHHNTLGELHYWYSAMDGTQQSQVKWTEIWIHTPWIERKLSRISTRPISIGGHKLNHPGNVVT